VQVVLYKDGEAFQLAVSAYLSFSGIIKKSQYHKKYQKDEINDILKLHILINFATGQK